MPLEQVKGSVNAGMTRKTRCVPTQASANGIWDKQLIRRTITRIRNNTLSNVLLLLQSLRKQLPPHERQVGWCQV